MLLAALTPVALAVAGNQLATVDGVATGWNGQGEMTDDRGYAIDYGADGSVLGVSAAGSGVSYTFTRSPGGNPIASDVGTTVREEGWGNPEADLPLFYQEGGSAEAVVAIEGVELGRVSDSGVFTATATDALGSLVLNGSAVVPLAEAFGAGTTAVAGQRHVYAGLETLPGLPYQLARARLMDPDSGRFVSVDPLGLGGGDHRFVYANNEPTGWVDPGGMRPSGAGGGGGTVWGYNTHPGHGGDYDPTVTWRSFDTGHAYAGSVAHPGTPVGSDAGVAKAEADPSVVQLPKEPDPGPGPTVPESTPEDPDGDGKPGEPDDGAEGAADDPRSGGGPETAPPPTGTPSAPPPASAPTPSASKRTGASPVKSPPTRTVTGDPLPGWRVGEGRDGRTGPGGVTGGRGRIPVPEAARWLGMLAEDRVPAGQTLLACPLCGVIAFDLIVTAAEAFTVWGLAVTADPMTMEAAQATGDALRLCWSSPSVGSCGVVALPLAAAAVPYVPAPRNNAMYAHAIDDAGDGFLQSVRARAGASKAVPGGPRLGKSVDLDAPGMTVSDGPLPGMTGDKGRGSIYGVPGEATPSGKPYIGRHDGPNPARDRRSPDGRDRTRADVIDGYDPDVPGAGAAAEQRQIDLNGGIDNLDNKINAE